MGLLIKTSHPTVTRQKSAAEPAFFATSRFHPTNSPFSSHYNIMLRTPLSTISGNRRPNTELTPYQRGIIVGAQALGHTPVAIGKALNLPRTTVETTIRKEPERNNGETKSRSGRPRQLSLRDQRYIIRFARINPRITYKQLRQEAGVICSKSTLYRTLNVREVPVVV